jgi:hypothetical protein
MAMPMMSATCGERAVVVEDRRHLQGEDRADAEDHQRDDRDRPHADADHLRPQVLPAERSAARGEEGAWTAAAVSRKR